MTTIAALRRQLQGEVFTRGKRGYGAARQGGGSTPVRDRHPAVVVQAANAADIARTIAFAREHALDLSVRGGGHDMLGASTTADGVLLDLCRMDRVAVDAATRTAQVGGGARSGQVFARAARHGLVPILGMSPNVGVGGLALGGGIGWLAGRFGATVDHVRAIEVVLADGRCVTADATHHPDLFRAMRGGGGNFGVAARFTLQLHRIAPVLAGQVTFRAGPAQLLPAIRTLLAEAGDAFDAGTSFTLGRDPVAFVEFCWSGALREGERLVRRLRGFAPVLAESVRRQSLSRFTGTQADASRMVLRGVEFDGIGDRVIDAVAARVARGGPDGATIGLLHYLHGALCRDEAAADTAFVRPAGHILCNIVAPLGDRERVVAKTAWATETWNALRRVACPRTYPNFLCETSAAAVRAAYGPHHDVLREAKRRFDPDNVFSGNRNIRP